MLTNSVAKYIVNCEIEYKDVEINVNQPQLETGIRTIISNTIDKFSIFIHTDDGNIAINAYEPRKAASLVKLPILIEAFRQLESDLFRADTLVYIERDMKVGGAGVINYLTSSNVYSYKNLMELMIIISDNTAANIVLDKVKMDHVNILAKHLKCEHTTIQRKFMDSVSQSAGFENYTSAYDMYHFLTVIANHGKTINNSSRSQILEILSNQQLEGKLASYLPFDSDIKLYHKSGELNGVEHDAAIFEYQNKRLEAVVMSEGWENNGIGNRHIADIGKLLIDYITSDYEEEY
ncbi:serine hydrolase [Virgibacillus sp. JSM 102003]|uniref:serine hydrolase n=1 Tax=Virgibacillus sp. JSM 102003 TaxID=1562108 RepID=UPI0035BEEBD8